MRVEKRFNVVSDTPLLGFPPPTLLGLASGPTRVSFWKDQRNDTLYLPVTVGWGWGGVGVEENDSLPLLFFPAL